MEEQQQMAGLDVPVLLPGDKLDQLFELQTRFARQFFDPKHLTMEQKEFWSCQMFQAITLEAAEAMNWMNHKHWKKTRKQVNVPELQYELVDMLHFLIEWMLIWGLTADDVARLYQSKMTENINRQQKGY